MVEIEWKYAARFHGYGITFSDPDGLVRDDVVPLDLILDEPFDQLVRQQLLAHARERAGTEGADWVCVVHVLSPDNAD